MRKLEAKTIEFQPVCNSCIRCMFAVEHLPTPVHVNMFVRAFSKIDDYNMVSESRRRGFALVDIRWCQHMQSCNYYHYYHTVIRNQSTLYFNAQTKHVALNNYHNVTPLRVTSDDRPINDIDGVFHFNCQSKEHYLQLNAVFWPQSKMHINIENPKLHFANVHTTVELNYILSQF